MLSSPTGGIALAFLFFTLHLNPQKHPKTFRQHVSEFDFLGLFLIVSGVVCVLIGFNQSESSWRSPATISLLTVGSVLLVCAACWESYTSRSPIIPPRLLRVSDLRNTLRVTLTSYMQTRTTAILLFTIFLHGFAFFGGRTLQSRFYSQSDNFCVSSVLLFTCLLSGARSVCDKGRYSVSIYCLFHVISMTDCRRRILPYSLGTCAVSLTVGFTITATGVIRPIIWASYVRPFF